MREMRELAGELERKKKNCGRKKKEEKPERETERKYEMFV